MGRFFLVLALAAGLGWFVAWSFNLLPDMTGGTTPRVNSDGSDNAKHSTVPIEKLGEPLYAPQPHSKKLANVERLGPDPVVVGGTLTVIEKMDACTQVSGQLLFVGQEVPEGMAQVAGVAPLLQGNVYTALVDLGDSAYYKFYQRLKEGDIIGDDEMVALINPAKAIHGILEKTTKFVAATAEEAAQLAISIEAGNRYTTDYRLFRDQRAISEKDLGDSKLSMIKTKGDWIAKTEATKLAGIDLKQASLVLSQHRVKNLLPVKSSIIKAVFKRTGEAVKELEPILQLYAIDRLTAEGLVELQFANRLTQGKKVSVEPTREASPLRVWRSHKKEITAVAVAYAGATAAPLAASASADNSVCLWDEKYPGPIGLLMHSQPVKSLACSPRGATKHWLLAGLANGSIAVWNLDAFNANSDSPYKPYKILEGQHNNGPVTALAFSPDGQYFASGSTDGSMVMWDTQSETSDFRLYPFDAEHGVASPHSSTVTALHFTPQGTLVSAGYEGTLRIWELRKKGAVLVGGEPIQGRSGKIGALGVSRDGSTILFDQDRTLQFLAPDGRAIATLQNPSGLGPFQTLAEFSPDATLLLTAGEKEGRLQLWKSPADGKRGFELRQFVTSEKSEVTSAAFFDANSAGEVPYAVSGGKDGVVYLWALPTCDDMTNYRIDNVVLTTINRGVETRHIRIGVELPNRDGQLIPGQPITIVIE